MPDRSEITDPRQARSCRTCGEPLTVFHRCPALALQGETGNLTQAVVETPEGSTEERWEEIRRRFPLTSGRIIAAINERTEE